MGNKWSDMMMGVIMGLELKVGRCTENYYKYKLCHSPLLLIN